MTAPVIAPMTPEDLDEIMVLERQCFTDPWTRHMYLMDLTQNEMATYLVLKHADAETQGHEEPQYVEDGFVASPIPRGATAPIVAYGGFWLMLDQAHIATLASHPDWRGCGLGQQLMLALLDAAIARGAATSTLEVRASNEPAQQLYLKLGYEITGRRRRYYRDGEDGLIMTTSLLTEAPMQARLAAARAQTAARLEKCFGSQPL